MNSVNVMGTENRPRDHDLYGPYNMDDRKSNNKVIYLKSQDLQKIMILTFLSSEGRKSHDMIRSWWSPKFVTLRILPDPLMALQILEFLPNHLLFDFRSSTYYWFMYLLMVPYSPYGIRTDNYVISALNDQNWMILNWIIFDQFSRIRPHVNLKSRPIDSSGFIFIRILSGRFLPCYGYHTGRFTHF